MHALVGLLMLLGVYTAHCDNVIFFDDFTDFDLSVWQHEITAGGGGNWEFEYYMNNRSNSYVRDSILYIKPTLTVETLGNPAYLSDGYVLSLWGTQPADLCTGNAFYGCERQGGAGGNVLNPIQSARLRTVNSFNFKYGKVEVRAKLPKGDWLWPAIWMMPTYNSYGNWPASGEIDIVESRGNVNYPPGGVNQFGSTLHWAPFYGLDGYPLTHETYTLETGDFSDDFHIFGLIWNSTNIITYLDEPSSIVLNVNIDQPFWQRGGWNNTSYNNPWAAGGKDAPFDQKFYLVFNVAVGGTGGYFPDGVGGKPWSDSDPHAVNSFWDAVNDWYATWNGEDAAMQIDWVKVSQ